MKKIEIFQNFIQSESFNPDASNEHRRIFLEQKLVPVPVAQFEVGTIWGGGVFLESTTWSVRNGAVNFCLF